MKKLTKKQMKEMEIIYNALILRKADYVFASVDEFMVALKKNKIKKHSTVLVDERINLLKAGVMLSVEIPKFQKALLKYYHYLDENKKRGK